MEFGLFLLAYAVLTPGSIGWRSHLPGAVVMTRRVGAVQARGRDPARLLRLEGDAALRDDRGRGRAPRVPAAGERAVRVRRRAVRGGPRAPGRHHITHDRSKLPPPSRRTTGLPTGRTRRPAPGRPSCWWSVFSNASGIIFVREHRRGSALAANAWIAAIHEPGRALERHVPETRPRACSPRPRSPRAGAPSNATIPPRTRSLDAEIDSGTLDRNTATITATLAVSPVSSEAPITTDSGMPSRTAPSDDPETVPTAARRTLQPTIDRDVAGEEDERAERRSRPRPRTSPTETVTASSTSS